jgi:hypothetical protein
LPLVELIEYLSFGSGQQPMMDVGI